MPRRILLALVAVTIAAMGILMLLAAALDTTSGAGRRVGIGMFGIGLLSVALGGTAVWFPIRRKPMAYLNLDGSAVVIKLRGHLQVAAGSMLAIWAGLLLAGALTIDSGGRWVLALFALVLALPVPDTVIGLWRKPTIRLDQDEIRFRGWASDASLAWRDVDVVRFAGHGTPTPLVQVSGRTGAPSWSFVKRGLVFGRARTKRPDIDIPVTSLDDPFGVFLVANALASAPDHERPGLVNGIEDLLNARAAGDRPEEETSRRG